jgi:hypothetical protein
MVNIKSLTTSQTSNLKDSELFRLTDSNNLYLRTGIVNRRILCSTTELKYGIGTSTPSRKLEIQEDDGNCLRLTYGGTLPSDLLIDSSGTLNILASNYVNITKLSLSNTMETIYGGTGNSSYQTGDILVGNSSGGLTSLPKVNGTGNTLITGPNGLYWSTHVYSKYIDMSSASYVSPGIFNIAYIRARNYLDSNYISLDNIIVDATSNQLSSSVLGSGLVTTGLTVVSEIYENQFLPGDSICVFNESRKVISTTTTTVIINIPFTVFNSWTLTGTATLSTTQFKFGTKSLTATATTAFATSTLGSSITPSTTSWTVEFFFRLSSVNAAASIITSNSTNTMAINFAAFPANITVSIGQGTSFNIMNAVRLSTTAITANSWFHFALSYDNISYRSFINGVLQNTTSSAIKIPIAAFSSIKVAGGSSAFNGFIDEFRISKSTRYTSAFSQPTAPFILDSNTIFLNHFETTKIEDDLYTGHIPYTRNSKFDDTYWLYTYATDTDCYVSPRSSENILIDLPVFTENIRKLRIYHLITAGTFYPITRQENWNIFHPYQMLVSSTTNITSTSSFPNVPQGTTSIRILLTHVHVGTISAGIIIESTIGSNQYLTTATAGTNQLIVDISLVDIAFQHRLSVTAGASSYYIHLIGFYVE